MPDDSDPFAPFQQFLDQFDPSGSSPMSGMGWPLSPAPLPGMGDTGSFSPEETTKRSVKQLYSALAAVSEGGSMGSAWQQYLEAFDLDAATFGPEQFSAATVRTYRIWFFSLTQLLVESYTLRLVHDELVTEDHRRSTRTQEWLWGLPQSDREQLLMRCSDVPDDLVEEMQTLRRKRDQLLYTFGGWEDVEIDESVDDARRSLEVLTALDDLVTDGSPFAYFPSDSDGSAPTDQQESADDGDSAEPTEQEETADDASADADDSETDG